MWKDFLISYLASIAAGITLAILGFGVYKIYRGTDRSTRINNTNINVTINTTEGRADKLTKELLKQYGP